MGLGPSYQPYCLWCADSKVTFIYKGYEIPELRPWWHQTSLYDSSSLYWACQKCIDTDVPEKYRHKFKYTQNYTVRGM